MLLETKIQIAYKGELTNEIKYGYQFWERLNNLTNEYSELLTKENAEYFIRYQLPALVKNKLVGDYQVEIERIKSKLYKYPGGSGWLQRFYEWWGFDNETTLLKNQYKDLLIKLEIAKEIKIQVVGIRYSSVNISWSISDNILDLFDNNLPYLQKLFGSYVAEAFTSHLDPGQKFDIVEETTVGISAINVSTTNTTQPPIHEKRKATAAFFWTVANLSLVVPVAIGAVILYYYNVGLCDREIAITGKLNTLFDNQNELIKHYKAEADRLQQFEVKILDSNLKPAPVKIITKRIYCFPPQDKEVSLSSFADSISALKRLMPAGANLTDIDEMVEQYKNALYKEKNKSCCENFKWQYYYPCNCP
ncbi:MAG TPA: hypothetical protein VK174_05900 [Chitinophagales bacterium]|nr:hypothetical protein [Chitinophagales bacterium]